MPPVSVAHHEVDPFELLLTRILRRAVAGAVLTSLAGLSTGCVDDTEERADAGRPDSLQDGAVDASHDGSVMDAGLDRIGDPIPCPDSGVSIYRASGLTPREPQDYLAIRELYPDEYQFQDAGTDWTTTRYRELSATGTPCATASTSACAEKVAKHPNDGVCNAGIDSCIEQSIVTTRGDEVKRWATRAELAELLAPIDTVDEAILMATMTTQYGVVCGDATKSAVNVVSDGYEVYATGYVSTCPIESARARLHVSTAGEVEVLDKVPFSTSGSGGCVGRVPAGLISRSRAQRASVLGDFLASCAHLEAASVHAFARMVDELRAHGAPEALIAAACEAMEDEVRHARVVAALARARGGAPTDVEIERLPMRSLEDIAIENATEGCVRETYGALLGAYQAEHAADRGLRRAMGPIARDEARHAALSHRVHAWALAQLDDAARERVRAAQREAVQALADACDDGALDAELVSAAGLPPRAVARSIVRELSQTLWQSALA